MAKGKHKVVPKAIEEIVEATEEVKAIEEIVEKPLATVEPRNFSVIIRETKKSAVICKSEYDTTIHIAI